MRTIGVLLGFWVMGAVAGEGVLITETDGKLRVEMNGTLFTEYRYRDVARPYLYPIIGPQGTPMTRDWPMLSTTNETTDHVHHKGLWFAHGDINGVNFWAENGKYGKTVHEKILQLTSGRDRGVIRTRNRWVAPSGEIVCTDEREIAFCADKTARMIDYTITLIASQGVLKFGDTKEGTMAIRIPTTMTVTGPAGKGHIVNSGGVVDNEAWGKRAAWVDYFGPVDGKTVGIAIFDHPQNPRYPTWWHVRAYGLFAANPFGQHNFENKPAGIGDMTLAAGGRVTFRYRFVFHTGDEKDAKIAARYQTYREETRHP